MKERVVDWLRLGRAQTYPADWLLVLVPFLHGGVDLTQAAILSVFMWFVHLVSFGENSLFDFTQGYDKADPSKTHHPLEVGKINVHAAMNVIVWGKNILMVTGCIFTLFWSPAPLWSMLGLFMWYAWGTAYNLGLSKESLFGFLPISICFTAMGAWAWFLSHAELGRLGLLYLTFIFFTILFQISWSGHLKEMDVKERSNILLKMGAKLEEGKFIPGKARWYGLGVKLINLAIGFYLFSYQDLPRTIWFIAIGGTAVAFAFLLTRCRIYNRKKELLRMSIEEILTIYLPIPLLLGWISASMLMVMGVLYFFLVNKLLWAVPYPKV